MRVVGVLGVNAPELAQPTLDDDDDFVAVHVHACVMREYPYLNERVEDTQC